MNQDTPAIQIKDKDLAANAEAFALLIEQIPKGSLKQVLDIRFGLGGWAREVHKRFPDAYVTGYEQDQATVLKCMSGDRDPTDGYGALKHMRFDPTAEVGRRFDLVCADFNTVTMLKRELLDEVVNEVETDRIVFTDVACSKLHLNFRSYGLGEPSLEQYWREFKIEGFRLVRFVKRHHAASSALYVKKSPPAK